MGLITEEIDYDHQLKQLTSEMTVTAKLNEHQQRTSTHKLKENRRRKSDDPTERSLKFFIK